MKKILYVVFLLLFSANTTILNAQTEVQQSKTIVSILGTKFYVHVVRPGQTLYSISKAYNVNIDDIVAANINIENKIKIGDAIRVPILHKTNGQHTSPSFVYHTVKAEQTLYFLSKKYQIEIADIQRYNPEIKHGLKIGSVLKIPTYQQEHYQQEDNAFFYHRIEPKQTLFSLAKTYNVDMDIIVRFNPEITNGLIAGELIKIPKGKYSTTEILKIQRHNKSASEPIIDPLFFSDPNVTPCQEFKYNTSKTFQVAILMPFSISDNNWLLKKGDLLKGQFHSNTENFYNFYHGVLLAVEKLRKEGVSIKLFIYDTDNNTQTTERLLSKPEMQKMDLLIGPVYPETFQIAAQFAKKHRINIVSPIVSDNNLVKNNPFVFQVSPDSEQRILATCNFLSNVYDSSIVVVHGGSASERKLINMYKEKLVYTFANHSTYNQIVFKEVNYHTSGIRGLEDALSVGMQNIIIIPSTNEVFVSDILSRMEFLVKNYKFSIIGMPNWARFENIDISGFPVMKVQFPTTSFVNYEKWPVKDFVKKYQLIYKTDPSPYSFQGFDVMYYFGTSLKAHGKHFQFCKDKLPEQYNRGLRLKFDFQRFDIQSGFINQGTFMLRLNKYLELEEQN